MHSSALDCRSQLIFGSGKFCHGAALPTAHSSATCPQQLHALICPLEQSSPTSARVQVMPALEDMADGTTTVDQFMTETSPEAVAEGLAATQLPGMLDIASTLGAPTAGAGSSATQSATTSHKGSRCASTGLLWSWPYATGACSWLDALAAGFTRLHPAQASCLDWQQQLQRSQQPGLTVPGCCAG